MSSTTEDTTEGLKKLQDFLGDLMTLGSLQGFRYFQPWLRGREELLLSVQNKDLSWQSARFPGSVIDSPTEGSGDSKTPPQEQSPLILLRSQKRTPGCGQGEVCIPPASPCDREVAFPGWDCTLFLLAGYAKYRRPYVWLRSHPRRLLRTTAGLSAPSDSPLKLDSTEDPSQGAGLIWEIIAELVNLCTHPPPPNPFSLDLRHFECLPLTERFLASGATISFLQKLLIDGDREKPYYGKVVEELRTLTRLHVRALLEVQKLKLREREEEERRDREDDSSLSSNE